MKLSSKAIEAARRIAQQNNVPVKKVIDAYAKAFLRRSTSVNRPLLFLPR